MTAYKPHEKGIIIMGSKETRENKKENSTLKLFDHDLFSNNFAWTVVFLGCTTRITKSNLKRESIVGAEERLLCVTLRYLVTGDSHSSISASYRIRQASISRIIIETVRVLRR